MIIQGKRIRNLARHFEAISPNTQVIIGIPKTGRSSAIMEKIGFKNGGALNDSVLPAATFGPVSRFNANGKSVPLKDQPQEEVQHWVYSTWHDWHGNSHSGYVLRSYMRYPRRIIPRPSIELRLRATLNGEELIVTDQIEYTDRQATDILHRVNLFLEIFGECHVFTEDLQRIIVSPIRHLNWRLLPPGRRTFAEIRREIAPIINSRPEAQRPLLFRRSEILNGLRPDFIGIGQAGFRGYLVYGFPNRSIYLLESLYVDNATYVFGEDWEALSQRTKAEILDQNLALQRIIHRDSWEPEIRGLFQTD